MERLHMNHLRDIIHRLRAGESERRIARDLKISRPTVHKYHELAQRQGYLEAEMALPDDTTLRAVLGPGPQPPKIASSLEPYREVVENLLKQGVEMTAMWQRLKDNYGYPGSYSAVRRFVSHLEVATPAAYTRMHTAAGEELQVDFGSVGPPHSPAPHPRSITSFQESHAIAILKTGRNPDRMSCYNGYSRNEGEKQYIMQAN